MSKTKIVTTDLPKRTEERHLVLSSDYKKFLEQNLELKQFSDNNLVQTIYFSNDDHFVPFLLTLKIRRYLPVESKRSIFSFSGKWFFDIKERRNEKRYKVRTEATLQEALNTINKKYAENKVPLRPFFMITYERVNYIFQDKKASYTRFSIDTNVKYYYFESTDKIPKLIGVEPYTRLEIKSRNCSEKTKKLINSFLSNYKTVPTISKKGQAYNLLCRYLYKNYGTKIYKELNDCEIELKIECKSDEIFPLLFRAFKSGKYAYKISDIFPYIFESSSVNCYYKKGKGTFKVLLLPDTMSIVVKGKAEVCNNSEGLRCILKRSETKQNFERIQPELFIKSKLEGQLSRYRKAFWVENPCTRRIYHISLDMCLEFEKMLSEIEVEYTGRHVKSTAKEINEQEIIDDIAKITKIVLSLSNSLKESTLTKHNWIRGITKQDINHYS